VKEINDFSDFQDLEKQILKMFKAPGNKVNPEDLDALVSIYQELTKQEFAEHHEAKNIHWLGRTFDHAPLVGALASLSSMQNEILAARAKAVNLLKSKVTTGEFSFNKIQQLVSGPGVATAGEEIELLVTMAAYDSDKNPVVTSSSGNIEIKEGIGRIKMKAGASDMKINGKVTIVNKSGVPYSRDWEWKVAVVKAQGSIALPEMMVLYRGYDNKVVPVVAGAVSSSISATNALKCAKSSFNVDGQKYEGYIVVPGGGSQVVLTLSGKDKDGKSKSYGSYKYKVRSFPSAKILGVKNFSKSKMFDATVGLEDASFTGVSFTVIGGKVIAGDNEASFTGSKVPPSAIEKVKVGKKVAIEVSYKRSGSNEIKVATEILKVTP